MISFYIIRYPKEKYILYLSYEIHSIKSHIRKKMLNKEDIQTKAIILNHKFLTNHIFIFSQINISQNQIPSHMIINDKTSRKVISEVTDHLYTYACVCIIW
jgi:hypothetical protein